MTTDEETRWMVGENIVTIIATVALVSVGFYVGAGWSSWLGLILLANINYRTKV